MRTIELTARQRDRLIALLSDVHDEDGLFDVDIDVDDNTTVNVVGSIYIDGYIEDDAHCGYMNGTGAWVETYRSASVEYIKATVYGEDEAITCDVDWATVIEVERYLNAA